MPSRTQIVCLHEGEKGRSIDPVFIRTLIKALDPFWIRPWQGNSRDIVKEVLRFRTSRLLSNGLVGTGAISGAECQVRCGPNSNVAEDTRSPEELIDVIENRAEEISRILQRLRQIG